MSMKKKLFFAAIALTTLAGCTSDEFVGDQNLLTNDGGAISFNMKTPAITRADKTGGAAATDLNNQFIVWGEKGEAANGAIYTADDASGNTHQLVFQNYVVNYTSNSAYTTTSNTKDWEYVGQTPYTANVTPATGETTQTIKYWDYGASNYVFTAVSALPADITAGRVSIAKTTSGSTVYDKGYVVTLTKTSGTPDVYPSLADLYFSDRNPISAGTGADRTTPNAYGGNATMTFRNSLSHVRVGMYETIPGYAISAISFKVTSDNAAKNASNADAFGAICPNVKTDNFEGTITVTYYNGTDGGPENNPKLTITPGTGLSKTDLILGTNINAISTTAPLAETATSPTWDTNTGTYTPVLPQISNPTNMKLKVCYTLYNSVTHETITVTDATAEVPADYLKWKPNFKYTYLFKISDNTNGHTGSVTDPAGLYPITFDAVEVIAEDGQAEYITTVSAPSITTFGVSSTGAYVTGGSEYAAGSDIYATFVESPDVKTPVLGTSSNSYAGNQVVNIYAVTTTDATNFPITEASVAEAIAANESNAMNVDIYTYENSTYTQVTDATTLNPSTTYYKADSENRVPGATDYVQTQAVADVDYVIVKIKATNINTDASTNFSAAPEVVDNVPAEDGTTKTIDAVKLTGVKAGTYAIEYEASAAWTGSYKKVYKVIVVQ